MKFNDYYEFYLAKHQNVWNRRCHILGQVATFSFVFCVLYFNLNLLFLLCTPFIVYPFAVPGHYLWEGNKPAFLSSSPLKAKLADLRMCFEMITGKIKF